MIKPEDFKNVDETINDVNLKKLEEMAEDDPTLEDKLETARQALRATREFHKDDPHRLTDLENEGRSIIGGYTTPMTHKERQEWWRKSELGKQLGVNVGEAE